MALIDFRDLAGARVVVTGSTGFIGEALCTYLAAQGATVLGVGRTEPVSTIQGTEFNSVDLSDREAALAFFGRCAPDYVVHLAGCVTGRRELEFVQPTLQGNLAASVNVLSAAATGDIRKVVLAGSLEEPGDDEIAPVPVSPYAASKWAAGGYARMFHALYDVDSVCARIFMVYGPNQKDLTKLVPYVCRSIIEGNAPQLMSGTRCVDWVYVDDIVEGLVRLMLSGPVDASHVDLGTGTLTTTGDVAKTLCDIARADIMPEIGALADRAMEREVVADPVATRKAIGWAPETDIEEGLSNTLDWYRENLPALVARESCE